MFTNNKKGEERMSTENYQELVNRLRKEDASLTDADLAKISESAIDEANAEVQQLTIMHYCTGIETVRVYMRAADNPNNFIYKMRLDFAGNPQANTCTLEILAQAATDFADEELRQAIEANPVTTEKIRAILRKA